MISEFLLFIFTTLGGIAAGAYIMGALFPRKDKGEKGWIFPVAILVMLGLGLLFVLFHLQQPMRFLNALANPTAGITLEAYFSMAFGLCVLIDAIMQFTQKKEVRGLQIVGAIFGLGLTCVMGYQYLTSMNVPAWCSWQTMPFFVVLDLAMGAAVYPLFNKAVYREGSYATIAMAIQAIAVLSLAIEAVHFAGVGFSPLPFAVGAVLVAVAIYFTTKAKADGASSQALAICALVVLGVVIARYAYYAASIL